MTAGDRIAFVAATPAGADCLAGLHHASVGADEPAWHALAFSTLLSSGSAVGLIAHRAGAPSGFILWRSVAAEAEILLLAVLPTCRRMGLGSALLNQMIRRAGATVICLEVAVDNSAAISMYRAARFVDVGVRPGYYQRTKGERVDALVLRREITNLA